MGRLTKAERRAIAVEYILAEGVPDELLSRSRIAWHDAMAMLRTKLALVHRAVRLRHLQRILDRARSRDDAITALRCLEAARVEMLDMREGVDSEASSTALGLN